MSGTANLKLFNAGGREIFSRWKTIAYDKENKVFMTTFDEDLEIHRGDVLIGEVFLDSGSISQ